MIYLPLEMWIKILHYLPIGDIMKLSLTNKFFFELTKENDKWILESQENLKLINYYKYISFIKHCKKIKYLQDFTPYFKYYISEFKNLLNNDIKTINIRIFDNYELQFIDRNNSVENLNIKFGDNIDKQLILSTFDKLKKIKNLAITNCNIDNVFYDYINKYKLKTLHLEACYNLTYFYKIKQYNLEKLSIINQLNNSAYDLNFLIKKQKKLKELTISSSTINNETSIFISFVGNNLTYLNLSYNGIYINDYTATYIANCTKLTELNLTDACITDYGLYLIVRSCKKLIKLHLTSTFIKDMSLIYISQYLPDITYLNVSYNNITKTGVNNIILRCKKLKYINIYNARFSLEYIYKILGLII